MQIQHCESNIAIESGCYAHRACSPLRGGPAGEPNHPALLQTLDCVCLPSLALTIALILMVTGCESVRGPHCSSTEQRVVNDHLYFGAKTMDGVVTSEQWADFLRNVVTESGSSCCASLAAGCAIRRGRPQSLH